MRNPVAKNLRKVNRATVQRDRKKDAKKGVEKYRLTPAKIHDRMYI